MFAEKTTKLAEPPGEVTTRLLEGNIVETTYRGVCGEAIVRAVLAITPEVLEKVPSTSWLLDVTAVTAIEAAARGAGAEILRLFRERGGGAFAVVVAQSPLRMMLSAIAFGAGVPVKVFGARDEALAYLRAEGKKR